jgi:beta-arrestin
MSDLDDRKAGTRVFKKTSPNGKITTYLGKRDFLDRGTFVDPIDGMVLIDEEYIKQGRKVIVQLNAAFRYGREDLDVLGLTFRKDLIKQSFQVSVRKKQEKNIFIYLIKLILFKKNKKKKPFNI